MSPPTTTNTAITWTVADTRVATIDANGLATGISVGSTAFTAKAVGGATINGTITVSYGVGSLGQAGGLIFYDQGSVINDWRYLEAAPSTLSSKWPSLVSVADVSGLVTGTAIGTGKENTDLIIAFDLNQLDAASAAKNCAVGNFSDWFLPSRDELLAMATHPSLPIKEPYVSTPIYYLSSSRSPGIGVNTVWALDPSNTTSTTTYVGSTYKGTLGYVRPVRRF